MDKKYILALLSGVLLLSNFVFGDAKENILGKVKEKKEAKIETMKAPEAPKNKGSNPFPKQDEDFVNTFKDEDIFKKIEDPFSDIDPWDD